jgi:copper ion binding protein
MRTIQAPVRLDVQGMTCGHCTATVERALKAVPGVAAVTVDLASARATVTLNPRAVADAEVSAAVAAALVAAVDGVGFDAAVLEEDAAPGALPTGRAAAALKLHVATMFCGSCERWAEDAVWSVPGVGRVTVNLAESSVEVDSADPAAVGSLAASAVTATAVAAALAKAGYTATLWSDYVVRAAAVAAGDDPSGSRGDRGPFLAGPPAAWRGYGSGDESGGGSHAASPPATTVVLAVGGMSCAACAGRVDTALNKVPLRSTPRELLVVRWMRAEVLRLPCAEGVCGADVVVVQLVLWLLVLLQWECAAGFVRAHAAHSRACGRCRACAT